MASRESSSLRGSFVCVSQVGDECGADFRRTVVGAEDRGRVIRDERRPTAHLEHVPRLAAMGTDRPSSDRAATAPNATITRPFNARSSASSHGWQASISAVSGLLVDPSLAAIFVFEVLHRVRRVHVVVGRLRRLSRHCHSTAPAGPTNGRPRLSSTSPGCSPTRINGAETGPLPNTVWVVSSYNGQPVQPRAPWRAWRCFASAERTARRCTESCRGSEAMWPCTRRAAVSNCRSYRRATRGLRAHRSTAVSRCSEDVAAPFETQDQQRRVVAAALRARRRA